MGKKKRFQRSDIPYADRLLMDKFQTVADQRNDAAKTAMMVACVALNDTEGLSYVRLTRFAQRFQELIQEYYKDPDIQGHHLQQRLESMGFIITEDGRMLGATGPDGEPVKITPEKIGG